MQTQEQIFETMHVGVHLRLLDVLLTNGSIHPYNETGLRFCTLMRNKKNTLKRACLIQNDGALIHSTPYNGFICCTK